MRIKQGFVSAKRRDIMLRLCAFLTLFMATFAMSAQTQTVKGTVIDNEGEPLIGANVVVVGTTNGVSTDVDGTIHSKTLLPEPNSASVM